MKVTRGDCLCKKSGVLYCCLSCALEDGCKDEDIVGFYYEKDKADDVVPDYGQLCPTCEDMYKYTKDL